MNDHAPRDLVGIWRQRADYQSQFGGPTSARLWQLAAVELDRSLTMTWPPALGFEARGRALIFLPSAFRTMIGRVHQRLEEP